MWATHDMTQGHLLFAAVMTAYVLVAVRWEEKDLARVHGEAYSEYRRRVSAILPFKTD
jgi:methanethiol S-methyltransferase